MRTSDDDVLYIENCRYIEGEVDLPGDKSISHRAIILSSIAKGRSSIRGIQKGKDCLATIGCMRKLGVKIKEENNKLIVDGAGMDGLKEPEDVLNCKNSGTTMRILSGVLAAQRFYSVLTGDSSLRKRPMRRIIDPLSMMGAEILAREGFFPPLSIRGGNLRGINYTLPVASAQVKSCLILAGLYARGKTRIREPFLSRDHTERMLRYMGVKLDKKDLEIEISGGQELEARDLFIPGDISSGAFFAGAAAILKGSCVVLKKVGINPTRSLFLKVLKDMGADVKIHDRKVICEEEVAEVEVRGTGDLKGIRISENLIPQIIDEIPILAVVACFARGKTLIEGAMELRVKETDRIKALVNELGKMGARIEEKKDGMLIQGEGMLKGAQVKSWGDHRIAMALAIAGICARGITRIDNAQCIDISFPGFRNKLFKLVKN